MKVEDGSSRPVVPAPKLGRFEELVLLAAVNNGKDVTAGAIRETLFALVGARKATTVITTIDRLIDKGCMTKDLEDTPRPKKGGRRCRIHNVTPTGLAVVGRTYSIFNSLAISSGIAKSDDQKVA
jgi:hypothetical protein